MTLKNVLRADARQWRYTGFIGIALTSVALIVLAQNYYRHSGSEAYSVGLSLLYNFIIYASFALFISPILSISAYIKTHIQGRVYWFLTHLLISIALVLIHMLLCNLILYGIGLTSSAFFPRFLTKYLTNVVQVHFLVYWAIILFKEYNRPSEEVAGDVKDAVEETQWRRFQVRQKGRILYLRFEEVYWIEALDHYQKLHTKEGYFLIKSSMKKLEAVLPASVFQRAHRSYFVNLDKVASLSKPKSGKRAISIELTDGTQLRLGEAYTARFKSL